LVSQRKICDWLREAPIQKIKGQKKEKGPRTKCPERKRKQSPGAFKKTSNVLIIRGGEKGR